MAGRVLFRADASARLGFGHVSRCLALAEALAERGIPSTFLTRSPATEAWIRRQGYDAEIVGPDAAPDAKLTSAEAAAILTRAAETGSSLLVVDHYGAGPTFLDQLAGGPFRLALIEDAPGRAGPAVDVVINPNLGVPAAAYRDRDRVLAGPEFALVRKAFTEKRPASLAARRGALRRVLVALGGGGRLERALETARDLARSLADEAEVRVVAGPMTEPSAGPSAEAAERVIVVGPLTPAELADEMASAQAAVATPSTICWELAALGVPMALVKTAGNQVSADELERRGIARIVPAGSPASVAFRGVSGLCSEPVRAGLSRAAAALIDGHGARRCAAALAALASAGGSR